MNSILQMETTNLWGLKDLDLNSTSEMFGLVEIFKNNSAHSQGIMPTSQYSAVIA